MGPLFELACRFPLIVPVPKFSVPGVPGKEALAMTVSAPVFNVPSVNPLASVISVVPPVKLTAPVKSLPFCVSVIVPVPVFTVVVPKIDTVPAV